MSATQYDPQDLLVGPIITLLAQTVQQQIPSIEAVYLTPTDQMPADNSVQFPYEIGLDETQYPGLLRLNLHIYITHLFKRNRLDSVYARMQPYIYPWLMVLSAWRNQTLTPDVGFTIEEIDIEKKIRIAPFNFNGQPYIGLIFQVCLVTEFPVDTNQS